MIGTSKSCKQHCFGGKRCLEMIKASTSTDTRRFMLSHALVALDRSLKSTVPVTKTNILVYSVTIRTLRV